MIAIESLICAIEHIERNLAEPLALADVASAAHISLSHLHKLFARVFQMTPGEYVTRRRLCKAADALSRTRRTVLDIALDFQYGSAESFSRAFKRLFDLSPSDYRRQKTGAPERFPKLLVAVNAEGVYAMELTRRTELSELSERILSARGTYAVIVDIDNLLPINEKLGRDAGDAAIAGTASRISRSLLPGMEFYRTGGDEFTILTHSEDEQQCARVVERMLAFAQEDARYSGGSFRFTVSAGMARIAHGAAGAKDALADADDALMRAKREQRASYRIG